MTSVSNGEIRAAIAYSSVAGSITQVVVRWRSFTLGEFTGGRQYVTINTEHSVNAQGGSSGGEESANKRVTIRLNGVAIIANQDAFGSNTYSCAGRLNSISVELSAQGQSNIGAGGLGKTGFATARFDLYTINLTDINPGTDFVFVDTTLPKFVRLPPVNSNPGRLLYFKLKGAIPTNELGNNVNGNGDQWAGKSIWINTYDGDSLIRDINSSAIYINSNYGCLTLFNDGIRWYVANYYTSRLQDALATASTSTFGTHKSAQAISNCINIFKTSGNLDSSGNVYTDRNDARRNGDNLCVLPSLADNKPQMCIVVYSGDATGGGRGPGNALLFEHSQNIDQNSSYSRGDSSKAYIAANQTMKNTGIVFISDGYYWYIVGWYNGSNWATDTSSATSTNQTNLGTLNSHTISILDTTGSDTSYVLQQNNPGSIPYLSIVKAKSSGVADIKFNSVTANLPNNIYINDNIRTMYFNENKNNTCVWFVRQLDSGFIRYFPIISYTPNN